MDRLDPIPAPEPERYILTSRREYLDAFDRLALLAQRELRIFDPDFFYLQINSPSRCELLGEFLLRGRNNRLYVAVHDTEHLRKNCARFLGLLQKFSDRMFIQQTQGEAARVQDCMVLADRLHFVRRPVHAQPRGILMFHDEKESQGMYMRFSEIWNESVAAVSASTSGL